ncbi:MAG TPA: hypothetical protein VFS05_14445 [Gemmatimonadaceae bacterium]|nr:hypothetical protein [Gemmatimonadaceae bacterium]
MLRSPITARTAARDTTLCVAALLLGVAGCAKKRSTADSTTSTGAIAPDTTAAAVAITPTPAGVALTVATKPGTGVYLTDANRRAVYVLEGPDGSTTVSCTGECATAFDPVTGKAVVATGDSTLKAAMIGVITLPNGGQQVTYNGRPLYYSREDQAPSDTKGQGKKPFGSAHLVSPEGKPLPSTSGQGGKKR